MSPSEIESRIRELKRELKGFGPALESAKRTSRVACYYGKCDRKIKAFRDYNERKGLYLNTKRNHAAIREELAELQQQYRNLQRRPARQVLIRFAEGSYV